VITPLQPTPGASALTSRLQNTKTSEINAKTTLIMEDAHLLREGVQEVLEIHG
jgi:hypothetical protein